jgi:hypothetical protein
MRKLGLIKTEQNMYKVTKQEKGSQKTTSPRCPLKIYEKNSDGGWSHLETLDAETPNADKSMVFTDLESDQQSWDNAIEAIRFYDDSEIIEERR